MLRPVLVASLLSVSLGLEPPPSQHQSEHEHEQHEGSAAMTHAKQEAQKDQSKNAGDYQKYMKQYVPEKYSKYSQKYSQSGSKNGGQTSGYSSKYSDYVDLYASMAGNNVASGKGYQGKQASQLQGFGNAMNVTFGKYVPGSYQQYASSPVEARVGSGGGGAGESGAMAKSQNQGGDYQQYMTQYAGSGSYKQYYETYTKQSSKNQSMQNSTINLLAGPDKESSESQGKKGKAGYMKYMQQYGGGSSGSGGYEKYMKQYAGGQGGSQGGQGSQADYEKYMKQYAGGQGGKGGSQADYEKYMKQYAGGQGGSSGASYEKYMKQYAGGQGGSSGPGNSAINLNAQGGSSGADYQKYMKQYAGSQGNSSGADYQKYMKQYAGGQGSSSGADYQKYMKQYAGGQGSSSGADYQKYMKQYAGGQGSSSGADYQKYMSQYAGHGGSSGGDYMKQYTGSSAINLDAQSPQSSAGSASSADYEKYMKKYAGASNGFDYQKYTDFAHKNFTKMRQENKDVVHEANDAQNKNQLDQWKEAQLKTVNQFVPAAYSKYANKNIEKLYNQRLQELANTTEVALAELETLLVDKPVNETERKEKEQTVAEHLRQVSEKHVEKVEMLLETLHKAAHDDAGIEKAANAPLESVKAKFSKRRSDVATNIKTLQESKTVDQSKMQQAQDEAGKLHNDELKALSGAYRQARDAASHAARGTQTEVRKEARQVEFLSDRMARVSRAHQDVANKLQNRVESASDAAVEQSELLTRRTEDSMDEHLSKAKDLVRQQDLDLQDGLRDLTTSLQAQSGSKSGFLAQRVEKTTATASGGIALSALVAGALALFAMYAKLSSRRSVATDSAMLLGYAVEPSSH